MMANTQYDGKHNIL